MENSPTFRKSEKVQLTDSIVAGIACEKDGSWGVIVVDNLPMGDGEAWLTWSEVRKLYQIGAQRGMV